MDIITGHRGVAHVTSADIQAFNLGIVGGRDEQYGAVASILSTGGRLAATITSNTRITIADGVGVCGGVAFRIAQGTTETVPISAGTAGYKRGDYITVHYSKNTSTGVESVELAVIEGTPRTSSIVFPNMPTASIYNGATDAHYVLYAVSIDGTTITSVSRPSNSSSYVYPLGTMSALEAQIDTLRTAMAPVPTLVTQMGMVTSAIGHMYQAQLAVAGGGTGTIDLDANIMSGTSYTAFIVSATYNVGAPNYDYIGLLFLNKTSGITHVLDIAKGSSSNVTFSIDSNNVLTIANGVGVYARCSILQIYG